MRRCVRCLEDMLLLLHPLHLPLDIFRTSNCALMARAVLVLKHEGQVERNGRDGLRQQMYVTAECRAAKGDV
eukprot:1756452-Amphidinium_carterae.1